MTCAFLVPIGLNDPARDWAVPSTKDLGQLVIAREHKHRGRVTKALGRRAGGP
jgi:hypothetical protein